jgi:hypothetical protein
MMSVEKKEDRDLRDPLFDGPYSNSCTVSLGALLRGQNSMSEEEYDSQLRFIERLPVKRLDRTAASGRYSLRYIRKIGPATTTANSLKEVVNRGGLEPPTR